ncbi:MAG TPA: hypothetical protein VE422_43350 [Terriglobia bacterium]|nr:hypothetical protein [Terriglobia bacterium]
MKRLHDSFGETLERLLGQQLPPSSARMESTINRVWERLHAEIVDAPAEAAPDVAVRRPWTLPKIGFVAGMAAAIASVVAFSATFVRSLWHGGPSADE